MKWTFIGLALGIILLIGVLTVSLYTGNPPEDPQAPFDPFAPIVDPFTPRASTTPIRTLPSSDVPIKLLDGRTVLVPDFREITQPEGHVPEQGYQVAIAGKERYTITYYPEDKTQGLAPYVLVSLLAEPLGEVRRDAENELRLILNISDADICALPDIQVWTSRSVNEFFAGKDLGLSFCPGAVTLP